MANSKNGSFSSVVATLKAHQLATTSTNMIAVLGGAKSASVFEYTQSVHDTIEKWGIDTSRIFAIDRNPKVIMRFIQFVHGINAKDYKAIDSVTACIIYALHVAGQPLNTDAIHYLSSELGKGKISPETKGVSRMTISKLFGRVGVRTAPTQISRSTGKHGFLALAGATSGTGGTNQEVTLNPENALVKAFFNTMNAASEAQIDEMTAPKKGGKKGE